MALEDPSLQVLSYAPGPVDTEMFDTGCNSTPDPELAEMMQQTKTSGKILSPLDTVNKLVGILESKKYIKGEHVDYFDV